MPLRKPSKPKFEKLPWSTYEKEGEIRGRARGKALAAKYIAAWETARGGPPATPETIQAACEWIEYRALEELSNAPGWDSVTLSIRRYPLLTAEGRALDMRVWRAFRSSAVRTIREMLSKYGCASHLRFLDMQAFLRYYTGGR